ncbi:MAG: efflux RND transporter periplasmic adaptor subunit [Bosea sp. (in: a-proteobacteria)]
MTTGGPSSKPTSAANDAEISHISARPEGAIPRERKTRWIWLTLIVLAAAGPLVWFAVPASRPILVQAWASLGTKPPAKTEAPAVIRGVRVMTVSLTGTIEQKSFTGVVAPRWETPVGFRVGGKISERLVEAAQQVKAGDVLFRLDDADYLAAVRAAQAELAALRAQARQAAAEEARQRGLLARGFATQSTFDRIVASASASAEQVKASEQKLLLAQNQLDYVALRALHDGVVTSIRAEAGQVVAQGQPVLVLARSDEREALVGIPEGQIEGLASWRAEAAQPSGDGKVALALREVAAQADPASRTFAARYSLQIGTAVALGSTISVNLSRNAQGASARLPSSAVMVVSGEASVWTIGPGGDRAERRFVTIVDLGPETTRVTGLQDGMRVVTLGVHRLDANMVIRVIEDDRTMAARP